MSSSLEIYRMWRTRLDYFYLAHTCKQNLTYKIAEN